MAYDPRAYVPGGSTPKVAAAIQKAGYAAKPAPRPRGAADPYGAVPTVAGLTVAQLSKMTPAQMYAYQASVLSHGPDYTGIPSGIDFKGLQAGAEKAATSRVNEAVAPYQQLRTQLGAQAQQSSAAATAFAQAFAKLAGGGNGNIDDPAAQKYALENFGGSYMGGMAASLGAQLLGSLASTFTAQDGKYAAQMADIMAQRPDLADKIYQDAVSDATNQIKTGRSIADMDFKNKIAAIAALGKAMKDGGATGTKPLTASGTVSYINNAQKVYDANLQNGLTPKQALAAARSYLSDPSVGYAGAKTWKPGVVGGTPAKPTKPPAYTDPNNPNYWTDKGHRVKVGYHWDAAKGKPAKDVTPAQTKSISNHRQSVINSAKKSGITLLRSYFNTKGGHPDVNSAAAIMWGAYGSQLLDAGISRVVAGQLIHDALRAASGGTWRWDPTTPMADKILHGFVPPKKTSTIGQTGTGGFSLGAATE